jgi:hypothetical protein
VAIRRILMPHRTDVPAPIEVTHEVQTTV